MNNDVNVDFINLANGQGAGSLACRLLANDMDPLSLKPYIGNDGRHYVNRMVGNQLQAQLLRNADATLRKDEWKMIDDAVMPAAKSRLRIVRDLQSAGLQKVIPNGMGVSVFQSEAVSDITEAIVSMEPAKKSEGDRPEFAPVLTPMPVIHKDFHFTARQIAMSRKMGSSIDTTTAELAGRRVAEAAEDMIINGYSMTYGGGSIYGLRTFPSRLTHIMASPDSSPYSPSETLSDILAMRTKSMNAKHYGPWVLYVSPAWAEVLDEDFKANGDKTLRERILTIGRNQDGDNEQGITAIRQLDSLTGYQMILVQMTSDVIRLLNGMNPTTLQWSTDGGMVIHFKVMAIWVPQLRADFYGNTGIVHGTAP